MIEILPQTKNIFSKEAQTLTHDLKNKVLELDVNQPSFQQQLDSLISTIKLLRDAAIKASFYIPNSPFLELVCNFESLINQLRDRRADLDWITKELILEVINMSNQVIDEYCSGIDLDKDWIELQRSLFAQISEHLQLESNEINSQSILELNSKENEPFNLEDTPEGLHLFDLDFDTEENQETQAGFYTTSIEDLDNSDSFLMIQLDQEDNLLDSDQLFQDISGSSIDELTTLFPSLLTDTFSGYLDELTGDLQDFNETRSAERLPMPELLANIFPVAPTEQLLGNGVGNDDETEIQGVKWNDPDVDEEALEGLEDDLDHVWNKFTAMESW